jgi:hypothetical protein
LLYVALADLSVSKEAIADYLKARARVTPEISIIAEELYLSKTLAPGKRKRATFFDLR